MVVKWLEYLVDGLDGDIIKHVMIYHNVDGDLVWDNYYVSENVYEAGVFTVVKSAWQFRGDPHSDRLDAQEFDDWKDLTKYLSLEADRRR